MKVRTFSTKFPKGHPREGENTLFVEQIWQSIYLQNVGWEGFENLKSLGFDLGLHDVYPPKHHTIRAGNHFKVGDQFSPRIWSGRPYASKQIEIALPITIKKVWTFTITPAGYYLELKELNYEELEIIAKNDGLSIDDFECWFAIHPRKNEAFFTGQIICWNDKIEY